MSIDKFDIVIVGAGPSGCACALALKDSGLQVALIDKGSFPRDKTCGDAIPGPSFKAINYLNPLWAAELQQFSKGNKINKTAVYNVDGKKVVKSWKTFSYNCKRFDFDNYLFELVKNLSNVTLIEDFHIKGVEILNDKVICTTIDRRTIHSKLIIGCDGATSVVKRKLISINISKAKNNTIQAVMSYFNNIEDLSISENEMFYTKKYPNGYFWIFPLGNNEANVGFGILPNKETAKKVNVNHAFEDILVNDPNVAPRFKSAEKLRQVKGALLPFVGKENKVSGNRFMLCGDAASLVDPISGAGIDNGIWSGIYAAEHAKLCFKQRRFDETIMAQYDIVIYNKLGKKLYKRFRLLKWMMRYPRIVNSAITLVSRWN